MADGLHRAFRVVQVIREGAAGVTLILDSALPAQPGQFVMAWLPGIEERPFSVMDDDPLSLTVAEVGPFTRALCALQPGERVWIRGPFGHGFELAGQRHLLVGGGSGVAALALLAKQARRQEHTVIAALGARTAEQLMLCWHFAKLGCETIVATDDGSAGYHGSVVAAIEAQLAQGRPDSVYGCGPEAMLRALARWAEQAGLPCWVSLERVMRCGIGLCGSCHLGDRLVCRDGPVFAARKFLQNAD